MLKLWNKLPREDVESASLDCVEKSCRYDSSGHSGEHAGDAKLIVGLDNLKGLSNLNYSIVL